MSPERGTDRKEEQNNLGEPEFVFWKTLDLLTMQEAERLGISSEAPIFVSPLIRDKRPCECGVHYSSIIYSKGLVRAQHYHEHYGIGKRGGIYHYMGPKQYLDEILSAVKPKPNWIAMLDTISFSTDPESEGLIHKVFESPAIIASSEEVNLLQFMAFSTTNQELKEGFLVTDEKGINLFPSPTKDHPFITELGFRIIEDGSIHFFNHSSLTPKSF